MVTSAKFYRYILWRRVSRYKFIYIVKTAAILFAGWWLKYILEAKDFNKFLKPWNLESSVMIQFNMAWGLLLILMLRCYCKNIPYHGSIWQRLFENTVGVLKLLERKVKQKILSRVSSGKLCPGRMNDPCYINCFGAWIGAPKYHKSFNWEGGKVIYELYGSDALVGVLIQCVCISWDKADIV